MKLGCVIMAAGASSRFGENKLLRDFLGKPLFACVLEAAAGVFDKTAVVTGYEPVKGYAENLGFLPVENKQPELGISHTIRLGLEELKNCDGVVFTTADQPLLSKETFSHLKRAFAEEPAYIHCVFADGKMGNPCLFPKEFFSELAALEGDAGGKAVIGRHEDRLRLHFVDEKELLDCDTPSAMENCVQKAMKKCEKQEKTI